MKHLVRCGLLLSRHSCECLRQLDLACIVVFLSKLNETVDIQTQLEGIQMMCSIYDFDT